MYRIAIGDDDSVFLKDAETLTARCMDAEGLERGTDYEIDIFSTSPPLLAAVERERYQLLLLDVEFGADNGLTVAASLRQKQIAFSLIYITSYRDYVFQSFDTHPLHYLLKPVDEEKLSGLLREDYRRRYADARLYLKTGGKHVSLAFSDVYAAEANRHRVRIYLRDSSEEWSGPLRTLGQQLPPWCFCRCHNSYFVNLTHVTELVRYEARLDNGQVIPVSKQFYRPAIEQYIAFLKN